MPELVAAGFRIHTLALSARADLPLLKQLSLSTGGYHALITDPAALTEVFVGVFDVINRGASLPLAEGSTFQVEPGVSELTLLHIGNPWAGSLSLVDPETRTFNRNSPRSEVLWHLDQDYEVITLEHPAVGRWRLVDLPGTIFPGELHTFDLRMESAGETIRDEEFLKLLAVSAELHGPEGREALLVEKGDAGRYQVHLRGVRTQGDYELQVSVAGKTFDRLKSVPFSVRNPMVIPMHPRPNGLVMWTEVIAPGLDHRGLRVTAKVKRPPAPSKLVPVQRMPGGLWKLGVDEPKGSLEIKLDIAGNYLNIRYFLSELSRSERPFRLPGRSLYISTGGAGRDLRISPDSGVNGPETVRWQIPAVGSRGSPAIPPHRPLSPCPGSVASRRRKFLDR